MNKNLRPGFKFGPKTVCYFFQTELFSANIQYFGFILFFRASIFMDLVKITVSWICKFMAKILIQNIVPYCIFQKFSFMNQLNKKIYENCHSTNIDEITVYMVFASKYLQISIVF